LKVKIAVEALKGQKTMSELASVYSVHPNQISRWKQEALESIAALLASADILLSSADSSGMPGSMSTNLGEPQ
jgi:transposase